MDDLLDNKPRALNVDVRTFSPPRWYVESTVWRTKEQEDLLPNPIHTILQLYHYTMLVNLRGHPPLGMSREELHLGDKSATVNLTPKRRMLCIKVELGPKRDDEICDASDWAN